MCVCVYIYEYGYRLTMDMHMWDLKAFECQELRARLCCRKISDSIFWLHCFTPRWLAGAMPCPKKVPKEMYKKKKDRKQIRDENISSILSFIYWVKGLTNATSCDAAWCPKHQTAKWCCWFYGHCLKEKNHIVSFFKGKILFSFTHASSPFPLETSGSFLKFNSFLFINLIFFI